MYVRHFLVSVHGGMVEQALMEQAIPMEPIPQPERHPRKCGATSKQSQQPCERWAMTGQGVCAMHGGKAPAALAKAQAAIERADMKIRGLAIPAVDAIERLLQAESRRSSSGPRRIFSTAVD